MNLKYHKDMTVDKWKAFPFFKQILMVATELNRAGKLIKAEDFEETKRCYERAIELLCLTVETLEDKRKLNELLRFKEMLCMPYGKEKYDFSENNRLQNTLLLIDKESYNLLHRNPQ